MREIVAQGLVDIMLMSASSNEVLTINERLFDNSHVTPAVRTNDSTDIWLAHGTGRYGGQPSQPFRSATIDHIQCGKVECEAEERRFGADLGLYSVTFNNDVNLDHRTLEAYKAFRIEAEAKGFRHFLEVFDPNAPRTAARRPGAVHQRPYCANLGRRDQPGPAAVFEDRLPWSCRHGSAGPLRPLAGGGNSRRFGRHHLRRLPHALGGEKIRRPRGPLRPQDQQRRASTELHPLPPRRGRRSTRARGSRQGVSWALEKLGIRPHRSLADDLEQTKTASSYSGTGSGGRKSARATSKSAAPAATPDFSKMSQAEKVQWNLDRWKRIVG